MAADLGAAALTGMHFGTVPISAGYLGQTKVYGGGAAVDASFNLFGVLYDWFIDFSGDAVASITGLGGNVQTQISDSLGTLTNGVGTVTGALAKFVPTIDTSSGNYGIIISSIPGELEASFCSGLSAVGGLLTPGNLLGLVNGLPVIGGALKWFEALLSGQTNLASITSLVGTIPVIQDLANLTGIIQNAATGFMADPVNFILDNLGGVVGSVSCGIFSPTSGSTANVTYPVGSIGNMARLLIPDGLVSLAPTTTYSRSQNVLADDGWLETAVATSGAQGHSTQIFRRYDASGAKASGVGIDLQDGLLSLVRRVGSTSTLVAPGLANYRPGDVIYLKQVGNVHDLFLNGAHLGPDAGTWIDSGATALVGSANRSVGMAMSGAQDLGGPRSFSPSLRYLRAA